MSPLPIDIYDESSKLLTKLKNYYVKETETPPLISERVAFGCVILYSVFFVAPFYLSPKLRSTPANSRDAPSVIRARTRAAGLTCAASTLVTVYLLAIYGHATPRDVLRLVGVWPVHGLDIIKVLSLVTVLFAGPLYESLIVDGDWRHLTLSNFKENLFDSWIGWRNYVVAPIVEEVVFRSLSIPLFILAKESTNRIIFLTPLIFGLAHVHHIIDFCRSHTPAGNRFPSLAVLAQGVARALFQTCYTSLFGFFTAFVFLRTGNLYATIVAHSFCNFMGFPRVWGRVGQYYVYPVNVAPKVVPLGKRDESPDAQVKVGNSLMQQEDEGAEREKMSKEATLKVLGVGWTIGYYALILLGAFGFYKLLFPMTMSKNALVAF